LSSPDSTARPLRVLYFIGSYSPDLMGNAGHEQAILALRERGHDVEVLTQINEPGVARYTRVTYSRVPVYRINLAARSGPLAGLARKAAGRLLRYEHTLTLLSAYRRHLRGRRYDLAHVEGAYPFGFVAALASGSMPYLANVQGADVIDLPENDYGYRRYPLPRAAVALALRRAALVRVNSPFMVGYLEAEKLAPPSRVVMVPRVLEDTAFPPEGSHLEAFRGEGRALLSGKYGIGLPRPVVMSLSRLHPFKGLEYLVDAIPAVVAGMRARGADAPWFVLCGPSRSTESYGDYRQLPTTWCSPARCPTPKCAPTSRGPTSWSPPRSSKPSIAWPSKPPPSARPRSSQRPPAPPPTSPPTTPASPSPRAPPTPSHMPSSGSWTSRNSTTACARTLWRWRRR
jgi:glycosyltransferase involved in cell wall biosynthesis